MNCATTFGSLLSVLFCGAFVLGCDTGTRENHASQTPGSVNVLAPTSGSAGSGSAGSGSTTSGSTGTTTPGVQPGAGASATSGSVAPAGSSSVSPAPSASVSAPASASATTPTPPAASGAAASPAVTGPQVYGTIPPDPETGFDGTLYLAGEQLAPGSLIAVDVNGVPTKVLPATFYSSELLGVYVNLTVAADYTFTPVAPDGTRAAGVTFTVANGGIQSLLGLTQPDVQMVYPPSLDANFSGTVWFMGRGFVAGCTATLQVGGIPLAIVPLDYLNERTVGLSLPLVNPGDLTITITNPSFLSSTPLILTVGQAPSTGTATPVAYGPGSIASPFVGSVHLNGSDIASGASVELRPLGGSVFSTTPLVRVSSNEAWWTLVYPAPGAYEARVVNPNGAAGPWWSFDVR